jgi:hypothetical protein
MEFDWKNWSLGGRIIICSACAALISLFMKWIDVGGMFSQNGFLQQGYLFLPFWGYPLFVLFKKKKMNIFGAIIPTLVAIIMLIAFMSSRKIEGMDINVTGSGAWLFLFALIALSIGIIKYVPVDELKSALNSSINTVKENVDKFKKKSENEPVIKSETIISDKPEASNTSVDKDEIFKRFEKLNDLKSSGVISEEEFETEKKKLLNKF